MQFLVEQARFLTEHFLTFDRKLKLFGTPIQCLREKSSFWQTNPDSWQKNPDFRFQKSTFSRQIQILDKQIHIFDRRSRFSTDKSTFFDRHIQILDRKSRFSIEDPHFWQKIQTFGRTFTFLTEPSRFSQTNPDFGQTKFQLLYSSSFFVRQALRFLFDLRSMHATSRDD